MTSHSTDWQVILFEGGNQSLDTEPYFNPFRYTAPDMDFRFFFYMLSRDLIMKQK